MTDFDPLDVTQDVQANLLPPRPAARDETPKRIGRYRVDKVLGQGGFGLVYLADANETQFAPMFGKIAPHREKAIALGNAEVGKASAKNDSEADKEALALRQWYVNGQGQTFVILDAGEFQMGSPESEAGRHPNEQLHRRRIGRRFAISSKEVTKGQWRAFVKSVEDKVIPAAQDQLKPYIRTDDSPMLAMGWYEAASYCNWLSEQEGIPKDQWCYESNDKGKYGPGMKAKEKFWELSGYRLPTEAEWEFACRAGASTVRYYGVAETLLTKYAWYQVNGDNRTWPVASLKPNDFGLFDMQGNAFEWVYDPVNGYPSSSKDAAADAPSTKAVSDSSHLVLRGGSFLVQASLVRSAQRNTGVPATHDLNSGFRAARTYPSLP